MRRQTTFLLLATCLCTGAIAQSMPGAPPSPEPGTNNATPVLVERQETVVVPADAVVLVPGNTRTMGAGGAMGSRMAAPDLSNTLGTGQASTMVNGQPNVDPNAAAIHATAHAARHSSM